MKRSVEAIEQGSVIDHIEAGRALSICALLGIDRHPGQVTIGLNLTSHRLGHKDVIKVTGRKISSEEASRIAVLAPYATISIVEGHEIVSKARVESPERVEGLVVCPNPRCITQNEPMEGRFELTSRQGSRWLRCDYCERIFAESEIERYCL